jgi:hypothetical protein
MLISKGFTGAGTVKPFEMLVRPSGKFELLIFFDFLDYSQKRTKIDIVMYFTKGEIQND